jgi:hypothetical protein
MFNLNKLIKMVKNGELLKKPFNVRKKVGYQWDKGKGSEEEGGYGDWGGAETSDEKPDLRTGLEKDPEAEDDVYNPNAGGTIDLRGGPKDKAEVEEVGRHMDQYILDYNDNIANVFEQTSQKMEYQRLHPKDSPIPPSKVIRDALNKNKEMLDVFAEKLKPFVPRTITDWNKVDIFVNTVLVKSENDIANQVAEETKQEEVVEQNAPEYNDPLTELIFKRLSPDKLSQEPGIGADKRSDYSKVLDGLKGIGDEVGAGVGNIYEEGNFNRAVQKKFGEPEGNDIDQRMNFFLTNAKLLKNPYFPEGNIFKKLPKLEENLQAALRRFNIVDPDVTVGLLTAKGTKAEKEQEDPKSPRSVMTKLLKDLAGDELLEILRQLTEGIHPSIIQWFKPKLFFSDEERGTQQVSLDAITENIGGGRVGIQKGKKPDRATTPEETEQATIQTGAVVESYLSPQLKTMGAMKDSTVTSLMNNSTNEYFSLKDTLSQAKGAERRQTKAKIKTKLRNYTTLEFLDGFATYALRGIGKMFEKEGVATKKRHKESGGKKKAEQVSYITESGEANVPEHVLRDIFKSSYGDKQTADDYVRGYMEEIESGKRADPWTLDWAKAVNYRATYDMFADMYKIKSQIKQAYKDAVAQHGEEVGQESLVNDAYNKINIFDSSKAMLEDFSGLTSNDINYPLQAEQKKKNFVKMTLDQPDVLLKRHKQCFEAREKYNKIREGWANNPDIDEDQEKMLLANLNTVEAGGELKYKTKKVDGKEVYVRDKNGELVSSRVGSVLKNMKSKVGENLEPILFSIYNAIQNSQTESVSGRVAEKNFLQLFNSKPGNYTLYGEGGINKNPDDPEGRRNTDFYHLITNNNVLPATVKSVGDFLNTSSGTSDDIEYFKSVQKLFKSKKGLRGSQKALREHKKDLKNIINNYLNPLARQRRTRIMDKKLLPEILKAVPPDKRVEFEKEVFQDWNGKTELAHEYYVWLQGLGKPLPTKEKIEKAIEDLDSNISELKSNIEIMERNAEIKKSKTSFKQPTASGSRLRMVYAEYQNALSKIDNLCKIKKFSYKFASVDTSSIDDTILGIEKDFENLLDSLIR